MYGHFAIEGMSLSCLKALAILHPPSVALLRAFFFMLPLADRLHNPSLAPLTAVHAKRPLPEHFLPPIFTEVTIDQPPEVQRVTVL